jgi:hypothetical protein
MPNLRHWLLYEERRTPNCLVISTPLRLRHHHQGFFFSYGSSVLISTCKFSILTCARRSTDFISRRPKKWLDIWSMHMPMFVLIGLHQIVHLIIEHLAFESSVGVVFSFQCGIHFPNLLLCRDVF